MNIPHDADFDCPLHAVIAAAANVSGGSLDCEIVFGECEDGHGFTIFPDDGSRPQVIIKPDQTIMQAMDILAHELAHVICGEAEGHGQRFESVYDQIFQEYTIAQEAKYGAQS